MPADVSNADSVNDMFRAIEHGLGMVDILVNNEVTAGLPSSLPRIPVGRFGTGEECAQAVLMVIGNAYMTGQTVSLSGGMSFN